MRKVGDRVKIRSKEWIDAQPKDEYGNIIIENSVMGSWIFMIPGMFEFAGQESTITKIVEWMGDPDKRYKIDIDNSNCSWVDEMFEPEEVNG